MMTEIPEDIRRAAKGVLCKLVDKAEATKISHQPFWSADETADIIAEVLLAERLAERERCAKIAAVEADNARKLVKTWRRRWYQGC